ncbi:MAG: RlpA-like double-psi beta-barrel domain-containing protein [Bacteroidota bacterium]
MFTQRHYNRTNDRNAMMKSLLNSLFLASGLLFCTISYTQTVTWNTPGSTNQRTPAQSTQARAASTQIQRGEATYYADFFEGEETAHGEVYRGNEMTAGHAHLPMGTILKVTRLDDGRSVQVRVNDITGEDDGIVVLSKIAAQQIGLVRDGRTGVSVQRVGFSNWNPRPQQLTSQATPRRSSSQPSTYSYNANAPQQTPRQPTAYGSTPYNDTRNQLPTQPRTPYPNTNATNSRTYYGPVTSRQGTQIQNNSLGETQPDFGNAYGVVITPSTINAPNPQSDPTAYQPATSQQQAKSPQTYNSVPNVNRPAVIDREVISNPGPTFYPTPRLPHVPTPVSTYDRSPVTTAPEAAPLTEVQVASNDVRQGYAIQLAAYGNLENAKRQVRNLQNQGVENIYLIAVNRADGSILNRVMVGPFPDMNSAQRRADLLKLEKRITGIVTRLP